MENFSPAANRKLVASGLVVVEDKDARGHDLCDYRDGEQHHKQSPGKIKCGKIGDSARRIRIIILTCIDTNNRR